MKKILSFALAAVAALGLTACVEDNPWSGISNIAQSTASVEEDAPVVITATTVNISSATLFYRIDGGANQSVAMTSAAANTFTGTIPGQAEGTVVTYWIVAEGTNGTSQSATRSFTVVAEAVDYTQLVLNEINGEQKFIEIYNKGTKAIDLDGIVVERNEGMSSYTQAGSLILPAGSYLVVTANAYAPVPVPPASPAAFVVGGNGGTTGPSALGSGLSAAQALSIRLFAPNRSALLDEFVRRTDGQAWQDPQTNVGTYTRSPNGTGGWFANTAANSTAGAANLPTTTPIPNLQTPGVPVL